MSELEDSFSSDSNNTEVLLLIPPNFFSVEQVEDYFGSNQEGRMEKISESQRNILSNSIFKNEEQFLHEIDNFLKVEEHNRGSGNTPQLNSTTVDENSLPFDEYVGFSKIHYKDFKTDDLSLQEEKLKREHCEQLIGILQQKILQYQQKLAVASKIDCDKTESIKKLKANAGLDEENKQLKTKISLLENETAETIHLLKKFQSKNEVLELKIENLTIVSKEMENISKKQIEDLEIRLSNSKKLERDARDQIEMLKKDSQKSSEDLKTEKCSKASTEREVASLRNLIRQVKEDKIKLVEKTEVEKTNLEMKQKKIFNNLMEEFSDKERKLMKELDLQRVALKNYYQAQLEDAIAAKVEELQVQLNSFQTELKNDAEKREKLLGERAIKQIELIHKKNEEEIVLINKKFAEEVDLYRVQLFNASRTIDSLEEKLNEYRIRRADIADNLHNIMETQWKKTLEILTSPSRLSNSNLLKSQENLSEMEQLNFTDGASNFNRLQKNSNNLSKSEENLKTDLLRCYIEKLLKLSPKSESDDEKLHAKKADINRRSTISKTHQRVWK